MHLQHCRCRQLYGILLLPRESAGQPQRVASRKRQEAISHIFKFQQEKKQQHLPRTYLRKAGKRHGNTFPFRIVTAFSGSLQSEVPTLLQYLHNVRSTA